MPNDGRLNINDNKRNFIKKLDPTINDIHIQLCVAVHARNPQHADVANKIVLHNKKNRVGPLLKIEEQINKIRLYPITEDKIIDIEAEITIKINR